MPLQGAILVCYGWGSGMLVGEEGVTTNFAGVGVVPLLGAIAGSIVVCFGGAVVMPLLGAITGCHCSVL